MVLQGDGSKREEGRLVGTLPMEKPVGARTQVSFAKPAQHRDDRHAGEQRGYHGGRRATHEIQGI